MLMFDLEQPQREGRREALKGPMSVNTARLLSMTLLAPLDGNKLLVCYGNSQVPYTEHLVTEAASRCAREPE